MQSGVQTLQTLIAAFQKEDYYRALDLARQLVLERQCLADAHYISGMCHSRLGQIEAAESEFALAVELHPKPEEVLHNQATMYRQISDWGKAEECYRSALSKNPLYLKSKLSLAVVLSRQERFSESVEIYNDILSIDPDNGNALSGLGAAYNKQNKPEDAISVLQRAVQLDQKNSTALNNLASSNLKLGRIDEYVRYAELAYQANPKSEDITANLARAYELSSEPSLASKVYQEALTLNSNNLETHKDYSKFLWASGKKNQYLHFVNSSLAECRNQEAKVRLLSLKGALALRAEDFEIAEEAYNEALAIQTSANARLGLADTYYKQGRNHRAYTEYQIAFQEDPNNIDLRHRFVTFLLSQGEYEFAQKVLSINVTPEFLQHQIALQTTLWRLTGHDAYHEVCNYAEVTGKVFIEAPPYYASREEFLECVESSLEKLFDTKVHPIDQTLFGGVQTKGDLWQTDDPVLVDLKNSLYQAACDFVRGLPSKPSHPFLKYVPDFKNTTLEYAGAWSVKLSGGGGHVDHMHPAGWLSSAHYVTVPQSILNADQGSFSGWLRLGVPPISGLNLEAEQYIKPEPGALILFPSYVWHGVEAFEEDSPRITTPFDMKSTVK